MLCPLMVFVALSPVSSHMLVPYPLEATSPLLIFHLFKYQLKPPKIFDNLTMGPLFVFFFESLVNNTGKYSNNTRK